MASSDTLESLLATREVVVVCGSGGVGKTSVAAAMGVAAATHVGGKVLVLTIDPARRLANALGLQEFGNIERRVVLDPAISGATPRGELYAAMLDTKASWDELVLRHAPDEETAYRILENRLYANVTGRFVQSHDYIAMERLYELHSSGEYDLIIVDTPPSRHTIDFLDAPSRMAEFFGGRLLRWLTMPYRLGGRGARVMNVASRPFYQMADRVLGASFLQDIAEFFLNFQAMYPGFVTRAKAVEALVHDRRTAFTVVTTLEGAPLREAERFCEELVARRLHLGALVLNRTLPPYLGSASGDRAAQAMASNAPTLAQALLEDGDPRVADELRTARVLRTIGDSFRNFAVVARREAELRAELARIPEVLVTVPDYSAEITDLAGLARVGACLLGHGSSSTPIPSPP